MSKERPILFSGPMVRALLAGQKTQTRRLVQSGMLRRVPVAIDERDDGSLWPYLPSYWTGEPDAHEVTCPYGQPSDRLWVRETWRPGYNFESWADGHIDGGLPHDRVEVLYAADGVESMQVAPQGTADAYERKYGDADGSDDPRWRPSIHMPRWASRITLEVTGVRVERLHDIGQEDAHAEGLKAITKDNGRTYKYGIPDRDGLPGTDDDGWPWPDWSADARVAFQTLWTKINGADSWAANPWVWVVEFRKVQP